MIELDGSKLTVLEVTAGVDAIIDGSLGGTSDEALLGAYKMRDISRRPGCIRLRCTYRSGTECHASNREIRTILRLGKPAFGACQRHRLLLPSNKNLHTKIHKLKERKKG